MELQKHFSSMASQQDTAAWKNAGANCSLDYEQSLFFL